MWTGVVEDDVEIAVENPSTTDVSGGETCESVFLLRPVRD